MSANGDNCSQDSRETSCSTDSQKTTGTEAAPVQSKKLKVEFVKTKDPQLSSPMVAATKCT